MTQEKKVCFFVRSFPVLSQTFVINQIRDLVASGVYVEVLAVNPILDNGIKEREIFDKSSSQRVFSILSKEQSTRPLLTSILGLLFCCLSFKRFNLIKLFLHFLKERNFFLAKDLMNIVWNLKSKKVKMDCCIAHFGSNGVLIDQLRQAKMLECKNLYTIFHGYEISKYDQLKLWKSYYAELTGKLLPISELWKRRLIEFGANERNIKVLHMGVDLSNFQFDDTELSKPLRLLSVARATEKKGLVYAIDAVLECSVECSLTIIGDGQLLDVLRVRVKKHSKANRVIFLGAQPPESIANYLKKSDIFILPSVRDKSGDMEGIPVSLMEAMASGVISLSTFHSGIPELIQDGINGFLVAERDSVALKTKIEYIANAPNLPSIRRNARITVESKFNALSLKNDLLHVMLNY